MSKITPAYGRDLLFQRLGLCMLLWNNRFPEVFLLSPPLIKACDRNFPRILRIELLSPNLPLSRHTRIHISRGVRWRPFLAIL